MSNIEKIRQEIERRKRRWMYDDLPIAMGRYYEDRDLLTFIDSLPEESQMPLPEDTVIFQKGVAEGRRLEREDGLAWRDIKSIVQIADKMLDDPKARVEYQNHNEEYYYKRVLDEYNILHKTQAE